MVKVDIWLSLGIEAPISRRQAGRRIAEVDIWTRLGREAPISEDRQEEELWMLPCS